MWVSPGPQSARVPSTPTQLKIHRLAHGWSQRTLAEELGISQKTLSAIETGRRLPSFALALRVADLLHSSIHELWNADATLRAWDGTIPWDRIAIDEPWQLPRDQASRSSTAT